MREFADAQQLLVTALNSPSIVYWLKKIRDRRGVDLLRHSIRVGGMAGALASQTNTGDLDIIEICRGGLLHDIGKLLISSDILESEYRLDKREWTEMQQHPGRGERLIQRFGLTFSQSVKQAIHHHHERWDGDGYPDGLKGGGIPLVARIVAIADGLDAMLSARSYRAALSPCSVRRILMSEKGTRYDPSIVPIAQVMFSELEVVRMTCEKEFTGNFLQDFL